MLFRSALLVILIWGTNFVAMKFGLLTLSPMLLSALRFVVASLPFLLFVRPPKSVGWRYLAAYGLVQGVGQFGMLFLGLKLGMPAGMASVVLQTQAFVTLLLAAFLLGEPARLWHWLGLVVSLGGLVAIGSAHGEGDNADRKSTRLNSSHQIISYAVFCFKKKKHTRPR